MMLLWLLLACGESSECSESEPCPFGSSCVEGVCESARCATSTQCAMEQYCLDSTCVSGCAEDGDCYPGYTCTGGSCVAGGCEDAHTDCAFSEFCNAASGECYEAAGYYCASCEDDDDCGGGENHCFYNTCLVGCQRDADCPAGFYCYSIVDTAGNVLYYGCYTACEAYEGYEGSMP